MKAPIGDAYLENEVAALHRRGWKNCERCGMLFEGRAVVCVFCKEELGWPVHAKVLTCAFCEEQLGGNSK